MAIQMTPSEYKRKYGVSPVAPTISTLDTTPAPIRMTQSEYDAKFKTTPQVNRGFVGATLDAIKDAPSDLREAGTGAKQAVKSGFSTAFTASQQVADKDISRGAGAVKAGGAVAQGIVRGAEELGLGLLKLPFSPTAEDKIGAKFGEIAGTAIEGVSEQYKVKKAELEASDDPDERKVAEQIDGLVNKYQTDESFKAYVDGAGGFAEFGAELFGFGKAKQAVGAGVDAIPDLDVPLPKFDEASRIERKVTGLETGLSKLEDGYASLRKANEFSKDGGADIRKRIVESDALVGAVDSDGVIRTKGDGGAVETYREANIGGLEGVVRDNLIREGKTISIQEVEKALRVAVAQSRLINGADLTAVLNGIKREISGITERADELNRVQLSKLHDNKISETANINFNTPANEGTYRKLKASVYKTLVEKNSDFNVKEVNTELGKHLQVIKRLELLDGKRVQGGRLGKAFAQLSGQLIGGAAGSVAGPAGAAIGGLLGGEGARLMKGAGMSRSFGKGLGLDAKGNPILEKAKDEATGAKGRSLKTADGNISVPSSVIKTKEIRQVEKDIQRNVTSQKKAIKAGDFTLVATLKEIYDILVEKLIEYVQEAQIGLSTKATISATVKRRIADELEVYDASPITIKGVKADTGGSADVDFRISQLQDKNNSGKFTDADAIEAQKLMAQKGIDIDTTDAPNLSKETKAYTGTEAHTVRSTKKANLGDQDFAQKIEPAGEYINLSLDEFRGGEGMVRGKVTFKNPLALDWETSRTGGWKTKLSEQYDNKTGKELSQAVIDDGYDGIIAFDKGAPKEAVNLQTFRSKTPNKKDLATEAKKYDSAEEFVKSKGEPLFHGTDKEFDVFDTSKSGTTQGRDKDALFFTTNKDTAKAFSADFPQKSKFRFTEEDKVLAQRAEDTVKEVRVDTTDALTLSDVVRLFEEGKIKTKPQTEGLFRAESFYDNNREAIKEAIDVTGKKVFKARAEGQTQYAVFDDSLIKTTSQLTDIWNKANKS